MTNTNNKTTNRFQSSSPYTFNSVASTGLPGEVDAQRPEGVFSHPSPSSPPSSPLPTAHCPLPSSPPRSIATLTNELLEDLTNPSLSAFEMCQIHQLTLAQLAAILDSDTFKQAVDALEKIANARQAILEPEARALATARLADTLKDKPQTPAHAETQRKTATQILSSHRTARAPNFDPKGRVPCSDPKGKAGSLSTRLPDPIPSPIFSAPAANSAPSAYKKLPPFPIPCVKTRHSNTPPLCCKISHAKIPA